MLTISTAGPAALTRPKRLRPKAALPSQYKNRPAAVRRAIVRVWELADEFKLTRSGVLVLQSLLAAGLDANNPYQAIFARKKTLARLSGVSEATVYRVLHQLVSAGWIIRDQQYQLDDGTLSVSEIYPSDRLVAVLLTPAETKDRLAVTGELPSREAPSSAELQVDVITTVRNEKRLPVNGAAITRTEPTSDRVRQGQMIDGLQCATNVVNEKYPRATVVDQSTSKVIRKDGRSVPAELCWLIDSGKLTYGQLFSLMRKATDNKQLLSHYVELRSRRIAQLPTANAVYRYLRSLICDFGVDASYLVARRERETRAILESHELSRWLEREDGRVFALEGREATVRAASKTIALTDKKGNVKHLPVTLAMAKRLKQVAQPEVERPSRAKINDHVAACFAALGQARKSAARKEVFRAAGGAG